MGRDEERRDVINIAYLNDRIFWGGGVQESATSFYFEAVVLLHRAKGFQPVSKIHPYGPIALVVPAHVSFEHTRFGTVLLGGQVHILRYICHE